MIKFFRLSKRNFVKENQMSSGHLVEIAPDSYQDRQIKRKL